LVVPLTSTPPVIGVGGLKRSTTETVVTCRSVTLKVADPLPVVSSLAVAVSVTW
jgi:hypothetical protein